MVSKQNTIRYILSLLPAVGDHSNRAKLSQEHNKKIK